MPKPEVVVTITKVKKKKGMGGRTMQKTPIMDGMEEDEEEKVDSSGKKLTAMQLLKLKKAKAKAKK